MNLSIVIPAFNEEKQLPSCLEEIRSAGELLTKQGWDWEVIVCDNNSSDGTAEIASSFGARVVAEPVNQIGRARNRGASVAQGEWLLFVDADSLVSPLLFEELMEVVASGKVVGGGACLTVKEKNMEQLMFPIHIWNGISRIFGYAAGSFLFCRRDVFEDLDGFSLQRYAGEELDLSRRLKRAGKKEGLAFRILQKGRLRTSARKLELYSTWEILSMLLKVIVRYKGTTGSRDACFLWYDGRR
jgi:glycosyltransferase involved in cell wall biosynthesis